MNQGIVIIHNELHDKWIEWLKDTNISILGIHPAGGVGSPKYIDATIEFVNSEAGKTYLNKFREVGIKIEYEYHALSWLLPRSEFENHPEYFRIDEDQKRNPDVNLCVSSEEALKYIERKAAELVQLLPSDTDKYYMWQDDIEGKKCKCEKCSDYNISDQVLIMMNAILKGIRTVKPKAKLAYLAYLDTALELPTKIKPADGIFLEFAPFKRVFDIAIDGDSEQNKSQIAKLPEYLDFFGKEDACVLEYWIDNSLHSGFQKPAKKLIFHKDVCAHDIKFYNSLGFDKITTFAGYLDDEYIANHGIPPVREYANIF